MRIDGNNLERLLTLYWKGDHSVRDEIITILHQIIELTYGAFHEQLEGDKDDLKSEALVLLLKRLPEWRPATGNPFNWATKLSLNRMRDVSRSNRRRRRSTAAMISNMSEDASFRHRLANAGIVPRYFGEAA